MGDYEEGRVMPHIRSAGTAACLAEMLHANHRYFGAEAAAVGAEALAYICATEDFITYRVRTRGRRRVGDIERGQNRQQEGGAGGAEGGEFPPAPPPDTSRTTSWRKQGEQ